MSTILKQVNTGTIQTLDFAVPGTDYLDPEGIGPAVAAAPEKATPVDADSVALSDSASAGALKRLSWANLKATLKSYFDTIYTLGGLGAVPLTRKITNLLDLSVDRNLSYSDVGADAAGAAAAVQTNLNTHTGLTTTAHGGIVPGTRQVNGKALSADITLSTADVADSADKRYCTDAQKTVIANTSGTNTGDQTIPTAYASNPAMDGRASPGSSANFAHGDHVHPSDTSRQAALPSNYTYDTSGNSTPSIAASSAHCPGLFLINYASPYTITAITDAGAGQLLTIMNMGAGNVTINRHTSLLYNSANVTLATGQIVQLVFRGDYWAQVTQVISIG
jgi:hypothetical protein